MRKLILVALLAVAAFSASASTYTNLVTGQVMPRLPYPLALDGVVLYDVSDETYAAAGWRRIVYTNVSTVVTTAIPPALQMVIESYRSAMTNFFGPGAYTNRAYDEGTVAVTLSLDPSVDIGQAVRLQAWSDIIAGWHGTTFDAAIYDATEIVTTNTITITDGVVDP